MRGMGDQADIKTFERMRRHGGNFVQLLGHAGLIADSSNLIRLKAAFPEYFEKYGPDGIFAKSAREAKRPKDMTLEELEALPEMSNMEAGIGAGIEGDDILGFTDSNNWYWPLHLGKNGWYKSTGLFPSNQPKGLGNG